MGDISQGKELPTNSFETAKEIRNLEIKLFWQRSNYFLVLNTAIATGVLLKTESEYAIPLSIFGFLVSVMWIAVNLGGKFWQDRWERKLAKIERDSGTHPELFDVSEEVLRQEVKESLRYEETTLIHLWKRLVNFLVMRKPSVSRTMILLSFAFMGIWITFMIGKLGTTESALPVVRHWFPVTADTLLHADQHQVVSSELPLHLSWESIWHLVAVFLGVVFAFWFDRLLDRNRKKRVHKSLFQLIAVELDRNIELMKQIVKEAESGGIIPYYQLLSENKDACWPMLVEHPHANQALIRQISKTYFEYRLINRTLDIYFTTTSNAKDVVFGQSTLPLTKNEITKSEALLSDLRAKHRS